MGTLEFTKISVGIGETPCCGLQARDAGPHSTAASCSWDLTFGPNIVTVSPDKRLASCQATSYPFRYSPVYSQRRQTDKTLTTVRAHTARALAAILRRMDLTQPGWHTMRTLLRIDLSSALSPCGAEGFHNNCVSMPPAARRPPPKYVFVSTCGP
jgi:hypothetical protein